jgi:rubrerythrin
MSTYRGRKERRTEVIEMGLFLKKKPGFAVKQNGKWYREEHIWGKDSYRCSVCGSTFRQSTQICPFCWAKMNKTVTDPVWVDEMALWEP